MVIALGPTVAESGGSFFLVVSLLLLSLVSFAVLRALQGRPATTLCHSGEVVLAPPLGLSVRVRSPMVTAGSKREQEEQRGFGA